MEKYVDRRHAGKILAESLRHYTNQKDAFVLALPRGGVPVAYEISDTLNLPLDVFIVRKLGLPAHEELAMGAIASGDILVLNEDVIRDTPAHIIEKVKTAERKELQRREKVYRGNRPSLKLKNKIIILVDDGIATGATMRAAIKAIRAQDPKEIIVAVPVVAQDTYQLLKPLADKFVCLQTPDNFYAVGVYYENFSQTEDDEVFDLLSKRLKTN